MSLPDFYKLPADLPIPEDDGAARHLTGLPAPSIPLASTGDSLVRLDDPTVSLAIVFCYPRTGIPGEEPLGGGDHWNAIPGARGCTPQSCAYRDHYSELRELGATVYGMSTQTVPELREAVERLELPFALLSDAPGEFSGVLRLPTFEVTGIRLLKRLTLVIERGRITHCFYPVFPSDKDAETVIEWLGHRAGR